MNPMQTSIIIPYYRSLVYLRQCLAALPPATPEPAVEVVVVDDASPDGTEAQEAVERIRRTFPFPLRLLRRPVNGGFTAACNHGAAAARGRLLVFLNVDTIPQPGWLTALLRFLARRPQAGVLGSKLLYPGRHRIQHLGGAFDNRRRAFHIYHDQPPDLPFLRRHRQRQWVTGACLLVRREDFARLDGFDESFVTSAEDSDLCFRVRLQLGHEVWLVADSLLFHHANVTGATDDGRLERTARLFLDKWGERIRCDEDEIYRADGFAPEFLHALQAVGVYRDFAWISAIVTRLRLRGVERQVEYLRRHGENGLVRDLQRLYPDGGIARWLNPPWPEYALAANDAASLQGERRIDELFRLLPGLPDGAGKEELRRELRERLHGRHFFRRLYNLAAWLQGDGQGASAAPLFTFLAQWAAAVEPELAGKACYKLALAAADDAARREWLKRCLALAPDHRAAAALLDTLPGAG